MYRAPLRNGLALSAALGLAACGSGSTATSTVRSTPVPAASTTVRQPVTRPARSATVHMIPGLEDVIGATVAQLNYRFGEARLDVWEGDARKLQFSGGPCILDVYLYPPAGNRGEPTATYVDARRASDGQDVDKAACARALKKR